MPLLYRQLQSHLSQWIHPKDQRHLQVFSENVAAILQAQSACLGHWLPVGYEDYRPVLETTLQVLPPGSQVMILADRGFEHRAFIRWLQQHHWSWMIRAKSDLKVSLSDERSAAVADLLPPTEEAYLFREVTILQDINCHLATANLAMAGEAWAVLSDTPPTIQTFAIYGQRFGGIEPHFKDYKSGAFDLIRSHLRGAEALSRLLMLIVARQ
jgi:hypothetical protein